MLGDHVRTRLDNVKLCFNILDLRICAGTFLGPTRQFPAQLRCLGAFLLQKLLGLAQIRVMTGALAIGIGRAALDDAVRYAGERQQFGRPINRFQAIQLKLAEMGTDLEAATRLVYYAAWLKDADRPHHREAAMAKLFASEAAASICDKAARVLASYGYAMEYPVQRHLRDVRFTLIGGGTSDILKLIIAKELSS